MPTYVIYNDAKIGTNCIIWPSVTIRDRTIIGHFFRLYSNCSIGSDGFGYRPSEEGKTIVRIPHNGNVVIGSFVDIGSNTCIDNAKYGSTIIGDYTKIGNLVQIGHNVIIGKGCMICGQAGISGSVTIGDGVIIAGNAGHQRSYKYLACVLVVKLELCGMFLLVKAIWAILPTKTVNLPNNGLQLGSFLRQ